MEEKGSIKANGTILLVEDEANIAKLYHYNLTKAGFSCEVAKNGAEGFEKAKSVKPDLIISDIMMPNVDGYEFRKMLLADSELKTIPFIFLTAKGEEESILLGYELEIEDYLIKTSSPKIIIAKVTAILKSLEKERGKVVGEVQKAADTMGAKVVPDEFPKLEGFVVKHWHMPYKNVPGGDFIDYIKIDDENLIVVLGDVMGKRWGAWYFAIAYAGYVRSAIRMVLESTQDLVPSEILKRVNDAVFRDERISEVFITLSVVVINHKTNKALYGGAGDLPIVCKGDDVTTIKSKGLLLGFSKEGDYKDYEIDLKSGNEIYLITDGIIESRNKEGKMMGQEGLVKIISEIDSNGDSYEMFQKGVIDFTGNDFEDDVSLVFIKSL
ncbi:MAG: response regulator [Ignavibacteria bacterium RBG_13_36_8]|nr:MAG: response regulator [Ignavibacteria bacterium RBG_13_36_8]